MSERKERIEDEYDNSPDVETDQHDITIRVYVRAKKGRLPTKRDVENYISTTLLSGPRLCDGDDWDVSATSLPDSE